MLPVQLSQAIQKLPKLDRQCLLGVVFEKG